MSKYLKSTAITVTATGQAITGPCIVTALGITAGVDAATVTVRDGATGPVRLSLGAGIGLSDGITFHSGLRFTNNCHVTVTGTTPNVHVAFENSQANQLNPS